VTVCWIVIIIWILFQEAEAEHMEEDGNNNIPDSISHYCDYLNSVVPKLHKTQRYNDIIQTSPMFFLVTFLAKNVSEWTTPPHWRRTGEVVYADGTALFLKAPRVAASDVQHLHLLLQLLGEATCLNTNISKLETVPIRCEDIDMTTIPCSFQATTAGLPCKYLGLPLHLGCLQKEDEQVLIDRVATKLPN
jgi:hypothetical protein